MKIICFGDSNTYGYENLTYIGGRYDADSRWVDLLAQKTGWQVVNEGQNGREIPGRAINISEDTDLFILMLGTNDLLQGNTAAMVTRRMESFINSLTIKKNKILLIAPPPLTFGVWVPEEHLIRESNVLSQHYRKLSTQLGVHFADAGDWNISLVFDGVHFSKDGHIAFTDGLYHHLQNLNLK